MVVRCAPIASPCVCRCGGCHQGLVHPRRHRHLSAALRVLRCARPVCRARVASSVVLAYKPVPAPRPPRKRPSAVAPRRAAQLLCCCSPSVTLSPPIFAASRFGGAQRCPGGATPCCCTLSPLPRPVSHPPFSLRCLFFRPPDAGRFCSAKCTCHARRPRPRATSKRPPPPPPPHHHHHHFFC